MAFCLIQCFTFERNVSYRFQKENRKESETQNQIKSCTISIPKSINAWFILSSFFSLQIHNYMATDLIQFYLSMCRYWLLCSLQGIRFHFNQRFSIIARYVRMWRCVLLVALSMFVLWCFAIYLVHNHVTRYVWMLNAWFTFVYFKWCKIDIDCVYMSLNIAQVSIYFLSRLLVCSNQKRCGKKIQ